MTSRPTLSNFGIQVYGIAAIVIGAAMMVWRDFAPFWHPVPASVPGRATLAVVAGILLVAAGVGVQFRQFSKPALIVLAILYVIAALLWIPRVLLLPRVYGTWGGLLEQFSPAAAAMLAYASLDSTTFSRKLETVARVLFGMCAISFGLNHFFAIPQTARIVPAWIPPGQVFWAIATGVADVLAGIAIITRVADVLAARLLTLLIVLYGLLIWLPTLIEAPRNFTSWTGNGINLAVAGAAWIVADVLSKRT